MGVLQEEIEEDIGSVPVCTHCGSEDVVVDANACWNPVSGLWEVEATYNQAICRQCNGETKLEWKRKDALLRTRIRELNDRFRMTGQGNGSIVITQGVQDKGLAFIRRAIDAVRTFDDFDRHNDPWGERDFGAIELDGEKLFWKIDMYDRTMTMGSPNPANEAVTARVLTVMLVSEY